MTRHTMIRVSMFLTLMSGLVFGQGERVSPGGLKLRMLGSSTQFASPGGVSADGRLVAYTDFEKGGSPSVYDTITKQHRHLVNLDWTGPDGVGEWVAISRDGKLVAFTWYRTEGDQPELRTVGTDGRGMRTVVKGSDWPKPLDWTPDGQQVLALFGPVWQRTELRLINVADGGVRVLKKFGRAPSAARVSPDGRWIAYRADDGIAQVMAVDGSADRQIFADDARAQLLDWTPDGKGIVFVSERSGTRALWVVPLDHGTTAGAPRLLRSRMADEITPVGIATDGRLFFVENTGLSNSYVLPMDGRPTSRLTKRFEGKNGFAAYSPDGKELAWFGVKEQSHVGGATLVIRNLANGAERSMQTPANGAFHYAPEWLGDSRSLVFRVSESGKHVLVRLDVETGELTTIAGVRAMWNSEFSADGKTYYYAKEKEGLIVALDVATGSEKTILELAPGTFVRGLTWSPDRRTLALAVQYRPEVPDGAGFAKSAIELCDMAARQCRPLIKSADRESLVGSYRRPLLFTPDGKALISTTSGGRTNRIQLFPLDGRPARQLVQSDALLFDTSISPDGKSLTYTESTTKRDLWVLENFLPVSDRRTLTTRTVPRAAMPQRRKPSGMTLRRAFEDVRGKAFAISSDGRWLIHLVGFEFHIRDNQTGRSRQLTFREPGDGVSVGVHEEALFSPDNRQVAYARTNMNSFVVRIVSVDGSRWRTVFRNGRVVTLRGWFPDSASLLIQTKLGDLPAGLYALSIADGSTKLVKQGDGKLSGAWMSPDGKLLAYWVDTNRDPWQQFMRILNMEDRTEVELPCPPSMNFWPRFVSKNRGIVFLSNRRGTHDLWYQPLTAGKPSGEQVLIKANNDAFWSVVGLTTDDTLYLSSETESGDAYLGEYDSSTGKWVRPPHRLSALATGQTVSAAFSSDGQLVSYWRRSKGGDWGRLSLVVQSLATKEEREILTDLGASRAGRAWLDWHCWFPDGKSVLLQGQDFSGRRFGIHRFDLTTGRSTFLRDDSKGWANVPAIGQDGKTVYLPLRGARPGRLVAWNVETGAEREILIGEELSGIALSPDGRSMAFARTDGQTRILEIIGTDGSGLRELYRSQIQPDGSGGIWTPTWLQDGRSLIFNTPKAGSKWPATMQRIPVQGGKPQSIGLTADIDEITGKGIGGPVWHKDGRHVTFNARIVRLECHALENFLPTAPAAK